MNYLLCAIAFGYFAIVTLIIATMAWVRMAWDPTSLSQVLSALALSVTGCHMLTLAAFLVMQVNW